MDWEDDDFGRGAGAEFHHCAADVGADGLQAEQESSGDLGVRSSGRDQATISRSRSGQRVQSQRREAGTCDTAAEETVTDVDNNACPAATTRMAWMSSVGTSFLIE